MCPTQRRLGITATQLYNTLVEAVHDLVFVVGRDGRYIMFNDRGLRSCGFRQKDVVGKRPLEAFGRKMGAPFERNNAQVLKSGKPLLLQEWVPLPDGPRCISTVLTPVLDRSGKVKAVMGIGRDITEMKRMMEQLEISAKKMESQFAERIQHEQLVKDIIKEAIPRRSLDKFFAAVIRMLGQSLEMSRVYIFEYDQARQNASNTYEWVAEGIEPLIDKMQDVPVSSQPWWSGEMLAGRIICLEDVAKTPSPELKALLEGQDVKSLLAIPIFTFGKPYGFVGLDECRKKRHWEKIDIELLNGVARIIAQKIERNQLEQDVISAERLAAIGRLTASFTHEINNPLQSIILQLEGIKDHVDEEGQRKLQLVTEGFDRISSIVSRLRNIHRGAAEKTDVDINEVLRSAYNLVLHDIDLKAINVRWRLDEKLPVFRGDSARLHHVFLNVMLNACDSMEKGGVLDITTASCGCHISIEIRDTGCGIDAETLPYVFEPFYSTKGRSGMGLGLFVSHSILSDHGGRISINSKAGVGTTVRILLPIEGSCAHVRGQ